MGKIHRRANPIARRLRRDRTDAECLLWSRLLSRQLLGCKFRRQEPVGRYIADFLCCESKLIIEIDGGQHSETVDHLRTKSLNEAGYRVVRFWNNEVLENVEGVLVKLTEILRDQEDSPSPSRS